MIGLSADDVIKQLYSGAPNCRVCYYYTSSGAGVDDLDIPLFAIYRLYKHLRNTCFQPVCYTVLHLSTSLATSDSSPFDCFCYRTYNSYNWSSISLSQHNHTEQRKNT